MKIRKAKYLKRTKHGRNWNKSKKTFKKKVIKVERSLKNLNYFDYTVGDNPMIAWGLPMFLTGASN